MGKKQIADIIVTNHGSLFMLHAHTRRAHAWLNEHLSEDAQWLGDAVAVEPRYVQDIVAGAQRDGLVVR